MDKPLQSEAPAAEQATPPAKGKVWAVNFAGNTVVDATQLLKQENVRTDLHLLRSKLDTLSEFEA